MPELSLNQAAKAARRAKSKILEDLSSGKLSGNKNELGHWKIEAAELFRVYPQNQSVTSDQSRSVTPSENQSVTSETTGLAQQVAFLNQERERERKQLQSTIDDLRERLNTESEERRKLTAMLTYQNQAKPAENQPTGSRMAWLVVLLVLVSIGAVLSLRFGLI